eukprot:TRINITY_DN1722_c0_g1_i1.p1 TRINITY_DN1722_c0_g1~~TRINITY_DN1722_c0_g1_i1.p1  ORF type:complete len:785 (+),score=260.30 TRINITY_DN1722_c0_g1_i1:47-2356(+)
MLSAATVMSRRINPSATLSRMSITARVSSLSRRSFSSASKSASVVRSTNTSTNMARRGSALSRAQGRAHLSTSAMPRFAVTEDAEVVTENVEMDEPKVVVKEGGETTKHEFQAETAKLLNIVARSLYTDREVFVREIVSNASDSLEKVRHMQLTQQEYSDHDVALEIKVFTDKVEKTITVEDTGIGMTKEELIANLGTIARSGSGEFVKKISEGSESVDAIIGQFGVGFYSTFMVGNRVTVYTKSATPGSQGYRWTSDGAGEFEIVEVEGLKRGTKVIVELNDESVEFSNQNAVETIIKKHSNFVNFPIGLNGARVNTIAALWAEPAGTVKPEQHKEFYQFVAHAYDEPMFNLHFTTDAPISIQGLFYIPTQHTEKYGMGKMQPGINLFSRRVLIQNKAAGILPDWLRFVKGVVDSGDIPLNISREHMQDSALIRRVNTVLTKRLIKFMDQSAKKDAKKYAEFWEEFGHFLKEGVCTDQQWKGDIAKLLRMETSMNPDGEVTSLEEYVSRMPASQKEIYYLCVPSRQFAETSPYYEGFKAKGLEVLFLYTNLDDFTMNNLGEFSGRKLTSIESAKLEEDEEKKGDEKKDDDSTADKAADDLTKYGKAFQQPEDRLKFEVWLKDTLETKVASVRETTRLHSSPAIVVDHESAAFRRMMKMVDPARAPKLPKQQLEVNLKHPIMQQLQGARVSHPELARRVVDQVFDQALVAAGLMDDARSMLPRMNLILEGVLEGATSGGAGTTLDQTATKAEADTAASEAVGQTVKPPQ